MHNQLEGLLVKAEREEGEIGEALHQFEIRKQEMSGRFKKIEETAIEAVKDIIRLLREVSEQEW